MQIKTNIVNCHKADSKPVKEEANGTVLLPPLVFPGLSAAGTAGPERVREKNGKNFRACRIFLKLSFSLIGFIEKKANGTKDVHQGPVSQTSLLS